MSDPVLPESESVLNTLFAGILGFGLGICPGILFCIRVSPNHAGLPSHGPITDVLGDCVIGALLAFPVIGMVLAGFRQTRYLGLGLFFGVIASWLMILAACSAAFHQAL